MIYITANKDFNEEDIERMTKYYNSDNNEFTEEVTETMTNDYIPDNNEFDEEVVETITNEHIPADNQYVKDSTDLFENIYIPIDEFPNFMDETPDNPDIEKDYDKSSHSTGKTEKRCDLMPLDVLATYFNRGEEVDQVLWNIHLFQKYNDFEFLFSAIDEFCGDHWVDRKTMFLEVAEYFGEDAMVNGENAWREGIPVSTFINAAVEHYLKWLRQDTDEPHDMVVVWNLLCCIWEVSFRHN